MEGKTELAPYEKDNVEITLPNKIGFERVAMACSASYAKMAGFLPERVEDLKTAVAEACVNAMQHGNKGRLEASVIVKMKFLEDTFCVSVMDQGVGMTQLPQFPGAERIIEKGESTKGLGIFLIQQLMDRVEFNQVTSKGHVVTMEIKLPNEMDNKVG